MPRNLYLSLSLPLSAFPLSSLDSPLLFLPSVRLFSLLALVAASRLPRFVARTLDEFFAFPVFTLVRALVGLPRARAASLSLLQRSIHVFKKYKTSDRRVSLRFRCLKISRFRSQLFCGVLRPRHTNYKNVASARMTRRPDNTKRPRDSQIAAFIIFTLYG